jgi:dihydrofolate reductase
MRKLKLQVQTTIDGFISGPEGQMDWVLFLWSDDLNAYVTALTEPVDTILLGRKLAEGFIPHWAALPDTPGADKMNHSRRVVFSKTLETSPWENASIAGGPLTETVQQLKSEPGGDLIVYGGGSFVSALLEADLIDELNLFVNPAAIGKGMPIFDKLSSLRRFQLLEARAFECGVAVLRYALIKT